MTLDVAGWFRQAPPLMTCEAIIMVKVAVSKSAEWLTGSSSPYRSVIKRRRSRSAYDIKMISLKVHRCHFPPLFPCIIKTCPFEADCASALSFSHQYSISIMRGKTPDSAYLTYMTHTQDVSADVQLYQAQNRPPFPLLPPSQPMPPCFQAGSPPFSCRLCSADFSLR